MTAQASLFDATEKARTSTQLAAIQALMLPLTPGSAGRWWTFREIQDALGIRGITASEAGISARLRELRKPEFGGYQVDRKPMGAHRHCYRVWSK